LPLNSTSSYGQSKFFWINESVKNKQTSNVYSPTDSVETVYSPACTPTTPGYLTTPTEECYLPYPQAPNGSGYLSSPTEECYLPYQQAPIGSGLPNRNRNQIDQIDCYENRFNKEQFVCSASDYELETSLSSTTPDWYNESINMNESFKFQTTEHHDEDSANFCDLNTTLTNVKLANTIDEHVEQQINRTESFETRNDNCPILFKQLMDLAFSTLHNCIRKSQASKQTQNTNCSNSALVLTKFCKFCKNNREPRKFYLSHSTMDSNGDVICPILQQYRCELCGATGTKAHTRSYCPFSRMIRETIPDINDTYEFYNKRSMIHSTDAHLFDNDSTDYLSDNE